jgi:UDP-GlcNAc:undecaprenyl-phosphate GlcNAc-1-phosphate transferase
MRIPYSLILATSAFAATVALTPAVIAFGRRWGAFDRPGPRSVHREPVPTLGGLAMVIAVLGVAWVARFLPGPAQVLDLRALAGLTWAVALLVALGVWDDLRPVSPWVKLAVQAVGAVVLFAHGFGVPAITNPFGQTIVSGPLNMPLTVAWILVIVNAVNVIDGLDGLAAGVVLIASLTLWWVGHEHANLYVLFICSGLIGATAGFLPYNFPPARVFMGDTGSQSLGMLLAAVSLLENSKGTATVTLLLPLVAMAVPIADGALAFMRRLMHGQPVFGADAKHVHHRLIHLGLSQRQAVLFLWFVCLCFGVMATVLSHLPRAYALMLAAVLAAGVFVVFQALEFIDRALADRRHEGEDKP